MSDIFFEHVQTLARGLATPSTATMEIEKDLRALSSNSSLPFSNLFHIACMLCVERGFSTRTLLTERSFLFDPFQLSVVSFHPPLPPLPPPSSSPSSSSLLPLLSPLSSRPPRPSRRSHISQQCGV